MWRHGHLSVVHIMILVHLEDKLRKDNIEEHVESHSLHTIWTQLSNLCVCVFYMHRGNFWIPGFVVMRLLWA